MEIPVEIKRTVLSLQSQKNFPCPRGSVRTGDRCMIIRPFRSGRFLPRGEQP